MHHTCPIPYIRYESSRCVISDQTLPTRSFQWLQIGQIQVSLVSILLRNVLPGYTFHTTDVLIIKLCCGLQPKPLKSFATSQIIGWYTVTLDRSILSGFIFCPECWSGRLLLYSDFHSAETHGLPALKQHFKRSINGLQILLFQCFYAAFANVPTEFQLFKLKNTNFGSLSITPSLLPNFQLIPDICVCKANSALTELVNL